MSYRLNTQIKPLIWVEAIVESHQHSRVEYLVKVSFSSPTLLWLYWVRRPQISSPLGAVTIQSTIDCQQCGNLHTCAA